MISSRTYDEVFMLLFKLLLPILAQLDPVQLIDDAVPMEEEVAILDDPSEVYEIEFDAEDSLDAFECEELDSECPR